MAILSYSADQLIYAALRDLGVIRSGQTAPQDVINDAFDALNQLIDTWLIDQLLVYAYLADIYTLNGTQQSYTIGPAGADFTAPRPTGIQDANIILNNSSPVVRQPVQLINVDQWADIRVQQLQPAIPLVLYYDQGFDAADGFGTINLWPGPQSSYQLEIYTWQQLTAFPNHSTAIIFPPAYANAIRKNLAVMIAPMMTLYGKTNQFVQPLASLQLVQQQAKQALALIRSYNAKTPILNLDPAFDSVKNQGAWNYMTGTATGRNG
jgi:hypothetical protein